MSPFINFVVLLLEGGNQQSTSNMVGSTPVILMTSNSPERAERKIEQWNNNNNKKESTTRHRFHPQLNRNGGCNSCRRSRTRQYFYVLRAQKRGIQSKPNRKLK